MDDGVVVVAVVGDAVVVDITGDVLDEIGSITRISLCSKLRQVGRSSGRRLFVELKRYIISDVGKTLLPSTDVKPIFITWNL